MPEPLPITFPQYAPPPNPKGIPVAHPKTASVMIKAMKQAAKIMGRKLPGSRGKGIAAKQTVAIKRKKVHWY